MPRKRGSSVTLRGPLRISIHGGGIDVDAKISGASGLRALVAALVEQLASRPNGLPSPARVSGSELMTEHDFDVVQRVIKHGELGVLQAIADLARHELEARRAAS